MTRGWIVNLSRDDCTREVERDHEPVCVTDAGEPVFEVWYWHAGTRRYFVLTRGPHDAFMIASGVIYFHPDDAPEVLRTRLEGVQRRAS
jgi:hypothetical protein